MPDELRRKHNLLQSTLGAALGAGDTAITFAAALQEGGVNIATLAANEHIAMTVDDEVVWLTEYTAGATAGTIARGKENTAAAAHANGAKIYSALTKRDVLYFDKKSRMTTSLTISNTVWTNVDTGMDITLKADVGDWIEVNASGIWDNQGNDAYMDVVSVVGGTPINSWGQGGAIRTDDQGIVAWRGTSTQYGVIGGAIAKQIVAGDLSGGTVLLRLRMRGSSVSSHVLFTTQQIPFHWHAKNLGPCTAR